MRGVNRVMLIGNLGKDPDVQHLDGNIGVAKFPLATTETYKDRSGKLISQTEWHTVVLWRGLAELAQKYLHKGSLIYVEGRLRTRSWEDKEGNKKYVYMLNNTALASPRTFISIIENYQQADGTIKVPKVLQPYVGTDVIKRYV